MGILLRKTGEYGFERVYYVLDVFNAYGKTYECIADTECTTLVFGECAVDLERRYSEGGSRRSQTYRKFNKGFLGKMLGERFD